MKVNRGKTRIVFVFRRIVIKFPLTYKKFSCGQWKKKPIRVFKSKFWPGICANWNEFMTWLILRASYLTPVYLSIGLVTIQRRAVGEPINEDTSDDLNRRMSRISLKTNRQLLELDSHNLMDDNWVKTPWGYQMIDFGGSCSGLSLKVFLVRWHEVLEKELKI